MSLVCDAVGHNFVRVGQHEIGGIPSHYTRDMDSVPKGSMTYLDYKCSRCAETRSEQTPFSWRPDEGTQSMTDAEKIEMLRKALAELLEDFKVEADHEELPPLEDSCANCRIIARVLYVLERTKP